MLRRCDQDILLIVNALEGKPSGNADRGVIRILQVSAHAATEGRLQIDALLGALEKTGKARVIPVVPRQQMLGGSINLIAR